jgi:hypothetical protein
MLEDELGFSRFMKVYKYIQVIKKIQTHCQTSNNNVRVKISSFSMLGRGGKNILLSGTAKGQ